jgi:tetratricopeptide (TPR) repeat protein
LESAFQLQKILPVLSVFWVRASDVISFDNAYRDIGQQLQIPGLEDDKADVRRLVKIRLSQESTGKWLMIVDNADNFEIFYHNNKDSGSGALSESLPFSTLGAILFTTRDREAATRYAGSSVIDIDEMDDEESRELLQRSLQNKQLVNDHSGTIKLLELLVNLPLAIIQAAAYLNAKGSTITEYLRLYKESSDNTVKLLSKDFEDIRRYPGMKNPVATTWLISFKQIQDRDPLAADYLAFMSCIKEQDIPVDLLPLASEFDKIEALGTLKAFGFIKERVSGTSYDIHRLVHTAMQNWLKFKDEWTSWNQKSLRQISNTFPWPKHENRAMWTMYVPHAQCIIATCNIGLRKTEETKELLWRLLSNLGGCCQIKGQYAEAEAMNRQTLELKETVLGKEHPDTLASMNNLAVSLRQQGKYVEAEAMHRQTLELKETVLGKEHPDTLMSMMGLASSLGQQGKYAEAEAMNRQTLQLKETVLGKEHPDTLTSMNNLAESLREQGKYAEAEAMHWQTLELKETVLGKEHPDTLMSMNNLAASFSQQGKYAEAEAMHRQTLQLKETVLGKEHPDTLRSMMGLATSVSQQGKYAEAEAMNRQTLQLKETVLGKEHPDTLTSMNNLAESLRQQGKYAEADAMHRQTLQLKETVLGKEHPDTLTSMMGLAISFSQHGKYSEAEAMHRQTLQLKETVLGKEHPDTLMSMNNLAASLCQQGKYAEAEAMNRQTLQLKETVLGKEHPDTLASMNNLATLLREQGKYAEAEAIHRR